MKGYIVTKYALALLICMHFSILFVYLLPENPINYQFNFYLARYVNPFFSQAWTLFAPNPISSNQSILVKFAIYKNGNKKETAYLDIAAPVIETRQKSFWSPSQRILKHFSSCSQNILDVQKRAIDFVKENDKLLKDTVQTMQFLEAAIRASHGHKGVVEYSKFVYANLADKTKDADSVYVHYKIFERKFPRFSKRKLDMNNEKYYTYAETVGQPARIQ